jgi:bis(5'-nucleosyl)-tetraphosphatase (symmetrical)
MRRIFVGDVQGCLDPLQRLLDATAFAPAADRLYFVGDLVNKGPDNAGVLREVIAAGAESVFGNHDLHLLDVAHGRRTAGAKDTFHDVLAAPDRDALLGWLAARPVALHLGDVLLVHAAVRPGWTDLRAIAATLNRRAADALRRGEDPLGDDDVRFAVTARFTTVDGEQKRDDWPPPGPPFENWADLYQRRGRNGGRELVVFGHFARQGLLVRPRLRGLDSGCVYGGPLTAWIAEEDRIVQVPAAR